MKCHQRRDMPYSNIMKTKINKQKEKETPKDYQDVRRAISQFRLLRLSRLLRHRSGEYGKLAIGES